MEVKARYLADESAYTAATQAGVGRFVSLVEGGDVATCAVVDLEILFSARSPGDYEDMRRSRRLAYERAPIDEAVLDRALDVQAALAARGRHRGPGVADLIVAASAERSGLTLLHCDHDFDAVAEVTGQPHELIERRAASTPRSRTFVVLAGDGDDTFSVRGLVEAPTPDLAIRTAVQQDLVGADQQGVVAVEDRHWTPGPATLGKKG